MKTFKELKQYVLDKEPDNYYIIDNCTVMIPTKKDFLHFFKNFTDMQKSPLCNIDISNTDYLHIYFPKEDIPYEIGYTPIEFNWHDDINILLGLYTAESQLLYELLKLL